MIKQTLKKSLEYVYLVYDGILLRTYELQLAKRLTVEVPCMLPITILENIYVHCSKPLAEKEELKHFEKDGYT